MLVTWRNSSILRLQSANSKSPGLRRQLFSNLLSRLFALLVNPRFFFVPLHRRCGVGYQWSGCQAPLVY